MLTKILITALVIVACFAYLRYQRQKNTPSTGADKALEAAPKNSLSSQFQWLAAALIVLTACAAIGFFIYGWLDDRKVMTVKVINPQTGDLVSYQVYKGELQERGFTTLQGQQVRISSSERIEITETP